MDLFCISINLSLKKCDHQLGYDFLVPRFHTLTYMSFNLLNLREQHSLLDYLKRDPCLPEELVNVLSKLEKSIAKLTDTVCVPLMPWLN